MDDFTPSKGYSPEDEYAPLESEALNPEQPTTAPENAPATEPVTSAPTAPQPTQPVQPVQPVQQPIPQPMYASQAPQQAPQAPQQVPQTPQAPQQAPVYTAYQQPNVFTQPVQQYPVQQPVQQPIQQPVQQPVQQPAQQPITGAYPNTYQPIAPVQTQQTAAVPQVPAAQTPYPRTPAVASTPLSPNPYAQGYQTQPEKSAQTKQPTPTGTKVFIIILCALLAAMVIGFIVYIATSPKGGSDSDSNDNIFSIGDDDATEDSYGILPYGDDNISSEYTELEEEITLKADNGDTLKRDDDNKDSVGEPDEKAKNITLEPLPKDKDDEKYTTQSAYDSVCDSVVTIECYKDKITDSTNDIVTQGTGTIISKDGYIVTNAHVISNSRVYAVNVVMNSGDKYQAKIIGYDTWTDLAVLKIDAKDLKAVTFGDSSLINIGDDVIAIGSPGGEKFQNSLTKGIVSAVDRELTINKYVRYIQSDAAISPGNSGGPLCNIYGQVIGITTVKTVATYYENMSFSIPSATVEEIVGDLMHYGYVKGRCRIGITGTEISEEQSLYYGAPAGILISTIDENGSLAGTDIKEGDIITELDGHEIATFQDIYDVLADHKPDDKVKIKVERAKSN